MTDSLSIMLSEDSPFLAEAVPTQYVWPVGGGDAQFRPEDAKQAKERNRKLGELIMEKYKKDVYVCT